MRPPEITPSIPPPSPPLPTETVEERHAFPRTGWRSSKQAEPHLLIEDHALIGDLHTAALVGHDGSIDFLCLPEFDSESTFASLLGTLDNGRWKIAPVDEVTDVRRRYRGNTMILETEFSVDGGRVRLVDFMPIRSGAPHVVRWVEGLEGKVSVRFELRPRFGSGITLPRFGMREETSAAIAGMDALYLRGGSGLGAAPFETEFIDRGGRAVPLRSLLGALIRGCPEAIDPTLALAETEAFWEDWAKRDSAPRGVRGRGHAVAAHAQGLHATARAGDRRGAHVRPARDAGRRAELGLSLLLDPRCRADPERAAERRARRRGACSSATGSSARSAATPAQLQIMYGIRGERRLTEVELALARRATKARRRCESATGPTTSSSSTCSASSPRSCTSSWQQTGNADRAAVEAPWRCSPRRADEVWQEPDHGIWEMRGPKRPSPPRRSPPGRCSTGGSA